ncbi:MAG: DOPA 4,5-dioxygenase family protein, partial [Stellaceae bacterium]
MNKPAGSAPITGYHAHLYYTPQTRPVAERLRAAIGERFPARPVAERLRAAIGERFPGARIGSWHDEPVGPHTAAMYQVAFAIEDFSRIVPWLMLNRDGLDVLVHPMTGDGLADHTNHAAWL